MNIEPVTGPGLDPRKSVVLKKDPRFEPVQIDPTVSKIPADLPSHQQTKRDAKKDQRRNIDRRKNAVLQFGQKRFHDNSKRRLTDARVFYQTALAQTNAFLK